jgi:hypothetical protein
MALIRCLPFCVKVSMARKKAAIPASIYMIGQGFSASVVSILLMAAASTDLPVDLV